MAKLFVSPAEMIELGEKAFGKQNHSLSTKREARFGTNGSKNVDLQKCTFYDHESDTGGGYNALYELVHGHKPGNGSARVEKGGAALKPFQKSQPLGDPVAWWDYRDAGGNVVMRVNRYEPKTFRQFRPDGKGGWIAGLGELKAPLYHLPEILAAPKDQTIWLTEGEKHADALRAWNLAATTNPMGAEKFREHHAEALRERNVVILPDNDEPGRKHAEKAAEMLRAVGCQVDIITLPGLPEKGDIIDWIDAGHTPEELLALKPEADPNALQWERIKPVPHNRITPRPWAYGRYLLFGHAAALGALDGGGKGAMATIIALSFITGRALLGEKVWRTGPVAIVTYEDDIEEWHRRIAAACLQYAIDYDEVIGEFRFITRSRARIRFAALSSSKTIIFPDGDEIAAGLKRIGAVLLIVDPFNHAHELEDGNNNAAIAKVAGEIERVAQVSGAAALVLHHLRKGGNGTTDDMMGAVSLRATFRSTRILQKMTPQDAERLESGCNHSVADQRLTRI